jgi:hypothetical protein
LAFGRLAFARLVRTVGVIGFAGATRSVGTRIVLVPLDVIISRLVSGISSFRAPDVS